MGPLKRVMFLLFRALMCNAEVCVRQHRRLCPRRASEGQGLDRRTLEVCIRVKEGSENVREEVVGEGLTPTHCGCYFVLSV